MDRVKGLHCYCCKLSLSLFNYSFLLVYLFSTLDFQPHKHLNSSWLNLAKKNRWLNLSPKLLLKVYTINTRGPV